MPKFIYYACNKDHVFGTRHRAVHGFSGIRARTGAAKVTHGGMEAVAARQSHKLYTLVRFQVPQPSSRGIIGLIRRSLKPKIPGSCPGASAIYHQRLTHIERTRGIRIMTPEEATSLHLDLDKHIGYVYCMTFPNGKKYVGQSIRQWKERWRLHRSKRSCCAALHNAILKYGIPNIAWEIFGYANTKEELNSLETHYITACKSIAPDGYNLKSCSSTCMSYSGKFKERVKVGLAIAAAKRKGVQLSAADALEHIAKREHAKIDCKKAGSQACDTGINIISYTTYLNNVIGPCVRAAEYTKYLHSQDSERSSVSKDVLTVADIGVAKEVVCADTGEHFRCASAVVRKYPYISPECISLCCTGRIRHTKGMHFYYADTPEDRLAELRDFWSRPSKRDMKRHPVICLDTGITYPSIHAASKATGYKSISKVCRGLRTSDRGLRWAYA